MECPFTCAGDRVKRRALCCWDCSDDLFGRAGPLGRFNRRPRDCVAAWDARFDVEPLMAKADARGVPWRHLPSHFRLSSPRRCPSRTPRNGGSELASSGQSISTTRLDTRATKSYALDGKWDVAMNMPLVAPRRPCMR